METNQLPKDLIISGLLLFAVTPILVVCGIALWIAVDASLLWVCVAVATGMGYLGFGLIAAAYLLARQVE